MRFLFVLAVLLLGSCVLTPPYADGKSSEAQFCDEKKCTNGKGYDKDDQCYCCSNCRLYYRQKPKDDPCPKLPANCGECLPGHVPVPNTDRCRLGFDPATSVYLNVTPKTGVVVVAADDPDSGSGGAVVMPVLGVVLLVCVLSLAVVGFLYRYWDRLAGRPPTAGVDAANNSRPESPDDYAPAQEMEMVQMAEGNEVIVPLLLNPRREKRFPSEGSAADSGILPGGISAYSGDSLDDEVRYRSDERLVQALPIDVQEPNQASTFHVINHPVNAPEEGDEAMEPTAPPQSPQLGTPALGLVSDIFGAFPTAASTPFDSGLASEMLDDTTYSTASTLRLELQMPPPPPLFTPNRSDATPMMESPGHVETPAQSPASPIDNSSSSQSRNDDPPSTWPPADEQLTLQLSLELTVNQRSMSNDAP